MNTKYKHSFTLVELMITLAILSALSGMVVFVTKPANIIDQANDQRRITEVKAISQSIDYLNAIALGNLTLGSANTIYTSLPDNTSATCASFPLPSLPSGFSYACKNSTVYRNNDGTGWIPINFREADNSNILATLPVDPVNDVNYYYSYNPGGSYEINAILKSSKYIAEYGYKDGGDSINAYERGSNLSDMPLIFPHNWVKVPGNSTLGTSDFWVMQFEAKYSLSGHGVSTASDIPAVCRPNLVTTSRVNWGKSSGGCTTPWIDKNIVSSPMGILVDNITHAQAVAACAAIGAHLITNAEWMTIADNALEQPSNWSSGVVGTGCMFADNAEPEPCGYAETETDLIGMPRDPRAALTLSNGSKIYYMSGNMEERVVMSTGDGLLDTHPNTALNNGTGHSAIFSDIIGYGDFGSSAAIFPSRSPGFTSYGWLYDGYNASYINRAVTRGAGWWYGGYSDGYIPSVFDFCSYYGTTAEYNLVGFRCAKS